VASTQEYRLNSLVSDVRLFSPTKEKTHSLNKWEL
jgi:hypothetical protein